MVTVEYSLPYGVRLMSVYLTESEHVMFVKENRKSIDEALTKGGESQTKSKDVSHGGGCHESGASQTGGKATHTLGQTESIAKPLANNSVSNKLMELCKRVANDDAILKDVRTYSESAVIKDAHRSGGGDARERYDTGEMSASIGQNLLMNSKRSDNSHRARIEETDDGKKVHTTSTQQKLNGSKFEMDQNDQHAVCNAGVAGGDKNLKETVEVVVEVHPIPDEQDESLDVKDVQMKEQPAPSEVNVSSDIDGDLSDGHQSLHDSDGKSGDSTVQRDDDITAVVANQDMSCDADKESPDVDTKSSGIDEPSGCDKELTQDEAQSSCQVDELQDDESLHASSESQHDVMPSGDSHVAVSPNGNSCDESCDVVESHDDKVNCNASPPDSSKSQDCDSVYSINSDNDTIMSNDNRCNAMSKQHSTESHNDSSESHDTLVAEQDVTISEQTQNHDENEIVEERNLPPKTVATSVPSTIDTETSCEDKPLGKLKLPNTNEEVNSRSEMERSSVHITGQENDTRTSPESIGDIQFSDSEVDGLNFPSDGKGDNMVTNQEQVTPGRIVSKRGDGQVAGHSRRVTNQETSIKQVCIMMT